MNRASVGFLGASLSLFVYWAYRLFAWHLSPLAGWVLLAGLLLLGLLYFALMASYRWGSWGKLARQVFLAAFLVRVGIVIASPQANQFIDIMIYMDAGQIMAHGINPYDHADAMELRSQWRTDDYAYAYHTSFTQKDWDYYAGSNLPLAQLLFGLWETTGHHALAYRIGFAFLDALLSAFVFLFVTRLWREPSANPPTLKMMAASLFKPSDALFYALWLGAFSPVLLKSGTLISEPKGTCLLLIVSALFCYYTATKRWPGILIGLSIAFMGLGAFFAPIIGWRTLTDSAYFPSRLSAITNWKRIQKTAGLVLLVAVCTLIWFIPYFPEVFDMAANRTARGGNMINHASMWRGLHALIPQQVQPIRLAFGSCFALVLVIGFLMKRLSIETLCAGGALFFLNVTVTEGSLDRVNVSLLVALLLTGREDRRAATHLAAIYLSLGVVALLASVILWVLVHTGMFATKPSFAYVDGTLCFLFMTYYLYWMVRQVLYGTSKSVLPVPEATAR